MGLVSKFGYRALRAELIKLTAHAWHAYYVGNLSVGRHYNTDADLVARLVRGLQVAGLVATALKRNREGIIEYRLYTREKITTEDLDAAMILTGIKGSAHVPKLEAE